MSRFSIAEIRRATAALERAAEELNCTAQLDLKRALERLEHVHTSCIHTSDVGCARCARYVVGELCLTKSTSVSFVGPSPIAAFLNSFGEQLGCAMTCPKTSLQRVADDCAEFAYPDGDFLISLRLYEGSVPVEAGPRWHAYQLHWLCALRALGLIE